MGTRNKGEGTRICFVRIGRIGRVGRRDREYKKEGYSTSLFSLAFTQVCPSQLVKQVCHDGCQLTLLVCHFCQSLLS